MIDIGAGESLPLSSITDPRDRELILATARNDADALRLLLPWSQTWVKERALLLTLTFNHLAATKALLDNIGSSCISTYDFNRCSREMQKLILRYDPEPDLSPRSYQHSPTFYQNELDI